MTETKNGDYEDGDAGGGDDICHEIQNYVFPL